MHIRREVERQEKGRYIPGRLCGCSFSPLRVRVDIFTIKIHKEVEADKLGEGSGPGRTGQLKQLIGLLFGAGDHICG